MSGIFSRWQPEYAARGIATFPVDGEKRPRIRGWQKVGLKGSGELAAKFNDTDALGYVTGQRSKVTVLDVDIADERFLTARSNGMAKPQSSPARPRVSFMRSTDTTASVAGFGPGQIFQSTCWATMVMRLRSRAGSRRAHMKLSMAISTTSTASSRWQRLPWRPWLRRCQVKAMAAIMRYGNAACALAGDARSTA